MSLRKLAGETAIYGTSYILSRVLHYILMTFYLTRVFVDREDEYGIYRDLYFYVAIILVLITFRMETTYFRYAKESKAAVTTMSLAFLGALSGLFLLLLWIFKTDVTGWLQYDGMETHIMVLGGVIFFDTLCAVPFASLRQQNRPWAFLALKLGAIVLNIMLVVLFLEYDVTLFTTSIDLNNHGQLFMVFFANLVSSGLALLGLLLLVKIKEWKWDFAFFNKMLSYSWPLVIVAIAGVINQSSSITFQKLLLPNDLQSNLADGGVYAAAASLAILLNLFTIAFNYAAEPFFFAHKDKEGSREVYANVALAFTVVGSLMMLGILGYMDIVQLILGKSYRHGLEVVPILLLSFLLLGIYYNLSAWYKLADKTLMGAWIAIGGTAITIALNVMLLPRIGVMGSAWASLACYAFMCMASYMQGQKHYPIPYKTWRIIGWIAVALLTFGVMQLIRNISGESLIVIFVVNTLLIAGYALLLIRFEKSLFTQIRKRS